jgi:DNA replication protein DnaC
MTTPQIERLREHCQRLRLYQIENELTAQLEQAAKKEVSYADFLDELLATEVGAKTHKHHQMRIAMARFPFQKTLESFDFKFQPSIDPKQIRELATGRYIHSGDNLLLLGPPGVGKSHLAVGDFRVIIDTTSAPADSTAIWNLLGAFESHTLQYVINVDGLTDFRVLRRL